MRIAWGIGCALLALGACHDREAQAVEKGSEPNRPAAIHKKPRLRDTRDLAAMRERGYLRLAVLPRVPEPVRVQGRPASADRILAQDFVRSMGLSVQLMAAQTRDELFDLVERGEADLAAGNLTITRSRLKRLAFSRPTRVVREVLVGKKGQPGLPTSPQQLAGQEVYVWGRSSYAETLRDLASTKAPGLTIHATRPDLDDETLLFLVSTGRIPLTVVDQDILHAVQRVDPGLVELCTLKEGRQIGWGVRKTNPDLLAAANAFVVSHALDANRHRRFTGDLAAIRKRGVLRVLTRNNSVSWFLHRGRAVGFDHALVQMLAKELGVRLEFLVPRDGEDLIAWLQQGRGDLIAACLTVTPERRQQVAFSLPYLYADEIVVARKGSPPIRTLDELRKHPIHVRRRSSYASTLERLAKGSGAFDVVLAPETTETEALIDQVGKGQIPLTVADDYLLGVELAYRSDVVPSLRLTKAPGGAVDLFGKPRTQAKSIAYACRKDNPELLAAVDAFVKKIYRGTQYNLARRHYFDRRQSKKDLHTSKLVEGRISRYDDLFKKYASRFGLDWRLIAAQCWQESRFDPKARSWVGARGLMQVMPATGKEMGFTDLEDPDTGMHAGVRYLAMLVDRFDDHIPLEERIYFALASYNGGRGHILDAMRLARARGLDPDRWFGNVEKCILLLENKAIARQARYGYCRGSEVHGYVRSIRDRYLDYARLIPR